MRRPELLNERLGDFHLTVDTIPEEYDWSWYEPVPPEPMPEPAYTDLPAPAFAGADEASVAASELTDEPATAGPAATSGPVPSEEPAAGEPAIADGTATGGPALSEAHAAPASATTPDADAPSAADAANPVPEPDLKQLFG